MALAAAAVLLLPIWAGSRKMRRVDESYNGRTVTLAADDILEIVLFENPTTGYLWRILAPDVATPDSPCRLVDSFVRPASAAIPGGGGIRHWQFKRVKPGTCKFEFDCVRSWESRPAPAKTYRLQATFRKGRDRSKPSE